MVKPQFIFLSERIFIRVQKEHTDCCFLLIIQCLYKSQKQNIFIDADLREQDSNSKCLKCIFEAVLRFLYTQFPFHVIGCFNPLIPVQITPLNFAELGQHLAKIDLIPKMDEMVVLHIQSFTAYQCEIGSIPVYHNLMDKSSQTDVRLDYLTVILAIQVVTRSGSGSWFLGQRHEEAAACFLQLCSACFVTSSSTNLKLIQTLFFKVPVQTHMYCPQVKLRHASDIFFYFILSLSVF